MIDSVLNDKVKNHKMTDTELLMLAKQTCEWWNALFVQEKRFYDIINKDKGGTPWDENETQSLFMAERLFLIVSLYYIRQGTVLSLDSATLCSPSGRHRTVPCLPYSLIKRKCSKFVLGYF